mmetsp:Transcript_45110/g.88253  ORF Transcript_45110/g.88253 Transcript_45110/m.88253 type:complete len:313 (+) Transcript_45110:866-1804(+)
MHKEHARPVRSGGRLQIALEPRQTAPDAGVRRLVRGVVVHLHEMEASLLPAVSTARGVVPYDPRGVERRHVSAQAPFDVGHRMSGVARRRADPLVPAILRTPPVVNVVVPQPRVVGGDPGYVVQEGGIVVPFPRMEVGGQVAVHHERYRGGGADGSVLHRRCETCVGVPPKLARAGAARVALIARDGRVAASQGRALPVKPVQLGVARHYIGEGRGGAGHRRGRAVHVHVPRRTDFRGVGARRRHFGRPFGEGRPAEFVERHGGDQDGRQEETIDGRHEDDDSQPPAQDHGTPLDSPFPSSPKWYGSCSCGL